MGFQCRFSAPAAGGTSLSAREFLSEGVSYSWSPFLCPTSPAAALSSGPGCLLTALLALPETAGIPKGEPAHVRGTFASWHRCRVAGCSLDRRPRTPKSSNRGFFRRLPETRAAPRDCAELWPCGCEQRGAAAGSKTSPCHSGSLQILPGWRTVVPNPHAHRRE